MFIDKINIKTRIVNRLGNTSSDMYEWEKCKTFAEINITTSLNKHPFISKIMGIITSQEAKDKICHLTRIDLSYKEIMANLVTGIIIIIHNRRLAYK